MLYGQTLIIAPHPDDEVLGCGGYMAKAQRSGFAVHLAVATTNNSEVRLQELDKCAKHFNLASTTMFYPNASFWLDSIPNADLVRYIERCIETTHPICIMLPHPDSFHQEHRAVSQATFAALRPSGGTGRWRPSVVALYEAPFDSWTLTGSQFRPTMYVALNQHDLDKKIQGMAIHASQDRPAPSERSSDAIRGLAGLRGAQCGEKWAEAYELRFLKI